MRCLKQIFASGTGPEVDEFAPQFQQNNVFQHLLKALISVKVLDVFHSATYIQQMLKTVDSLKDANIQGREALDRLLAQIPIIELDDVREEQPLANHRIDLIANIRAAGQSYHLFCEVLSNGQPRYVKNALLMVRDAASHGGAGAVPIIIAPYFSPATREMCRESEVGYLDLEGNARIAFGGVFIDRQVSEKPTVERRELRSLFRPKSAQVLRVMLREPDRPWRVAELAEASGVSLGHVSNVRTGLLDREWAKATSDGLYLSQPGALLDAWHDSYEAPAGERKRFYTTLHGSALEEAARDVMGGECQKRDAVFASFSAANWLAPYGRTGTHYFYATETGLEKLKTALKLAPATKGENVIITLPKDEGLLSDTVEPAPNAICTSTVQTYLDLSLAGERGEEAAQHLRQERMIWPA